MAREKTIGIAGVLGEQSLEIGRGEVAGVEVEEFSGSFARAHDRVPYRRDLCGGVPNQAEPRRQLARVNSERYPKPEAFP